MGCLVACTSTSRHTYPWRVAGWWLCMAIQSIGGSIQAMGQFDDCRRNDGSTWMLAELSNTPMIWVWIWDVLLAIHLISLLIPKRYAVTSTHLFADGQRYEWNRLRLAKKQPRRRIMLLRKGWGPFGPLPLGGKISTIAVVLQKIQSILSEEE